MQFIKKLLFQALLSAKKCLHFFKAPQTKYVKIPVPYRAQFASPELIQSFISGERSVFDDKNWRKSGARTKHEYAIWAWNGCGMSCLQMILEHKGQNFSHAELGCMCLTYGGYVKNETAAANKDYKNYYEGLFYAPFVACIRQEFALHAQVVSPMTITEILRALEKEQLVTASVHPDIRVPDAVPTGMRGHLVLVVGYDLDKKLLFLHNPSGYYNSSQEFAEVSFSQFEKFFTHRGIVIH